MANAIHVENYDEFKTAIEKGAVLVDFYADRCGPCKIVAPVLEELAGDFAGKATVVKVDVDAINEAAAQYSVMSIPTVQIFVNGSPFGDAIIGAHPKETYVDALTNAMNELGDDSGDDAGEAASDTAPSQDDQSSGEAAPDSEEKSSDDSMPMAL